MIIISRKTQDEFEKELKEKLPNIKVIGRYQNNQTPVECECLIDHHVWSPIPSNLTRGHGCPVCAGRVVIKGINDMLTTCPEVEPFLVYKEDGYLYTKGSHKHINFKCPYCSNTRKLEIKSVTSQGFSCPVCGDGISYPNKFARGFLKQLNLDDLQFEYRPDWADKYSYDNYFKYKEYAYILEMDGMFHYKDNTMSGMTKEEAQGIDDIKDALAKQNNITVIRIDCRKSDPFFIEENIRSSLLNKLFDLNVIDWKLCNQYGNENLIKKVCDFYQLNKAKYSRKEVCEFFSIGTDTFSRYIKIGNQIGWVKDDINKSLLAAIHNKNPKAKHVLIRDVVSNELLFAFKSINLCIKYFDNVLNIKLNMNGIRYAINNKDGVYKGYKFEYASEQNQ